MPYQWQPPFLDVFLGVLGSALDVEIGLQMMALRVNAPKHLSLASNSHWHDIRKRQNHLAPVAIVKTDPFSQVPVFINLKFGSQELASGTAFFYRRGEGFFLISNSHNFSGRDPKSKQPRPSSSYGQLGDFFSRSPG